MGSRSIYHQGLDWNGNVVRTPGNIIKDRIRGIVAKLLLEYGENSKELTDHLEVMIKEIKKNSVDTKLAPHFLTTMLNVINVIHQKRDEKTDEFIGDEDEEEEKIKEVKNVFSGEIALLSLTSSYTRIRSSSAYYSEVTT